ncbi:MAG: S1C family serine protease [Haloechinothrix sp.]
MAEIEAISCDGGGSGTGFLIEDGLVATAAHVVADATTVAVTVGESVTTGRIIGFDPALDVALLETSRRIDGYRFVFAETPPRVGDPVAAIGFPEGNPMSLTQGVISGLEQGLIQTDAALNPGNSGGPLLDLDGDVLGVVVARHVYAEGIAWAVAGDEVEPQLDHWRRNPQAQPDPGCDDPFGPAGTPTIPDDADQAAEGIAWTLADYFTGINSADYSLAWDQLSPAAQQRSRYDEFAAGVSTSYDFNFAIHDVVRMGVDAVQLHLTFTSIQAPGLGPEGESCTDWSLDYTMRRFGERWFIDRVLGHAGGLPSQPCM